MGGLSARESADWLRERGAEVLRIDPCTWAVRLPSGRTALGGTVRDAVASMQAYERALGIMAEGAAEPRWFRALAN